MGWAPNPFDQCPYKKVAGWEFPGGLVGKDLALSLQGCGFSPWLSNFYMPRSGQKKERKK